MCGIAGILRSDGGPVASAMVGEMIARLAHRGPDGSGIEVRGALGIGHRRLAIIDPAGGAQPIANEDGQIWVTCNGEIYNHRELRAELELQGHRFATASDSEVVVHAYEQWGDACVERLRGMFALAVADWRRGRLFLARDHFGIKPLYYLAGHGCFAFASELQALRAVAGQTWRIDRVALDQYLTLGYIPAPLTIFAGVAKLPPAQRMSVDLDGRCSGPVPYWRLTAAPDRHRSPDEWPEAIDAVLRESVRTHLMSDVPFGALLSGGVDSSAVVAHMAQLLPGPLRTFSIGFTDAEHDETRFASAASVRWGTRHEVEIVTPDAFALLPELVRHHGEPFGDSSAIPTWHLARMARRSVAMVLSGDGGDEAFAGYDTYGAWLDWLPSGERPAWWRAARGIAERIAPARYPRRAPTPAAWLHLISQLASHERRRLWRPEMLPPGTGIPAAFSLTEAQDLSPAALAQRLDIAAYLPGDILAKVDIASMRHGLEVRTPFVDVRVMEFAATIPDDLDLARDDAGRWQGKLMLKRALERYYPREFLNRPKQGFAVPLARWLAPAGRLDAQVEERLLGADSPLRECFSTSAIRRLVAQRRYGPLWLLLVLAEWLRQNRAEVAW